MLIWNRMKLYRMRLHLFAMLGITSWHQKLDLVVFFSDVPPPHLPHLPPSPEKVRETKTICYFLKCRLEIVTNFAHARRSCYLLLSPLWRASYFVEIKKQTLFTVFDYLWSICLRVRIRLYPQIDDSAMNWIQIIEHASRVCLYAKGL